MSQTQKSAVPVHARPAAGAEAGARTSRWAWLMFGVAVVAGVTVAAWDLFARGTGASHAHGPAAPPTATPAASTETLVQTTRLSPGGIVQTSAQIGSVEAYEEADLYAKISGYLKTLHVDYGTPVKRGQLLAEIDDPEVVKEKERAEAELVEAKAMKRQAEARISTARADLKAAHAAVDQARSEIRRTTSKRSYRAKVLQRYRDLVARNAETQQVVDEQEENYEASVADELSARAAEATARAQDEAAQAKLDQAQADLAEAEAHVHVAEATLAKAAVFETYTRITSPYDGVITQRTLFPGAFIRSATEGGTVPLLSVARTDKVRVVTNVPDLAVPQTDVGDPAEVTLDALPGRVFKGKVSRFADTEDVSTRTMHTEIDLPNSDDLIRPGMSGIARIILGTNPKLATLPASCLVGETRGDRADVFVAKDGKAKKVQIRIGDDDGLRVEVVEGLGPEDDVIVDTSGMTDGLTVRPERSSPVARAE